MPMDHASIGIDGGEIGAKTVPRAAPGSARSGGGEGGKQSRRFSGGVTWKASHRLCSDYEAPESHLEEPFVWLPGGCSSRQTLALTSYNNEEERDRRQAMRRASLGDPRTAESPDMYVEYVARRLRRESYFSQAGSQTRRSSTVSSCMSSELPDVAEGGDTAESPAVYAEHLMRKEGRVATQRRRKLSSPEVIEDDIEDPSDLEGWILGGGRPLAPSARGALEVAAGAVKRGAVL
eukprot:CAMPEP_0174918996 /NCGR_PEP_ID=MMETSP1355-20121228/3416_1 /TAXON_ID=464990 /ORGANISM="Hemiselmis tepida, Strain CCMP443" /LENGTH=234 /DNA_ID=CAMNT_0016164203 /DNA_START=39 /DNA_END=744 /DNA_ORIENTATION=-